MPTSYTTNLRLALPATGELSGTWGNTVNNAITTLLDDSIGGYVAVVVSAADQALTANNGLTDQSRQAVLSVSNTYGAAVSLYAPPVEKLYVVYNSNATYNLTFKVATVANGVVASGGSTVVIPPLKRVIVYVDTVNVVEQMNYVAGDFYFASDVLIGTTSARTFDSASATVTPSFQVEGITADSSSASLMRNTASSVGPTLFLGKSRSGALGGVTIVQDDDPLGQVLFEGADGVNLVEGAVIRAEVDGTPGVGDMPGRLVFGTTPDGGSSPQERMRIDAAGNLGLGVSPSGSYKFEVSGAASFFGSTVTGDYTTNQATQPFPVGVRTRFQNLQTTDNTYTGIEFSPTNTSAQGQIAYIGGVSTSSGWGATIVFGRRTGATAYAESMRIDSGGDVGIGTTDPTGGYGWSGAAHILGIAGDGSAVVSSYGAVALANNRATPTATDDFGVLAFTSPNSVAGQTLKAFIKGTADGAGGVTGGYGGQFQFYTKADNTASGASLRMQIDNTGDVQIGTSTAGLGKVRILDSGAQNIELTNLETNVTSKTGNITVSRYTNTDTPFTLVRGISAASTNTVYIGGSASTSAPATDISFYTGALSAVAATGTERMIINSGGDVGIGTTDPTGGYAWTSAVRVLGISGDASASTSSYGAIALTNNRATPSATDQFGILAFTSQNSVTGQKLKAFIAGIAEGAGGVTGGYGGAIGFYTKADNTTANNAERMRITSDGFVGIGTNNPASKLEVSDAGVVTANFVSTATGANGARVVLTHDSASPAIGDILTELRFNGNDSLGAAAIYGAISTIAESVTSGARSARMQFNSAVSGAAVPTLIIDKNGYVHTPEQAQVIFQTSPTNYATTVTMLNTEIAKQIVTFSGTTFTATLPTGANLEAMLDWQASSTALDVSFINNASGTITIGANANTTVGSLTIATGTSAQFRIRRVTTNTFTIYRLS